MMWPLWGGMDNLDLGIVREVSDSHAELYYQLLKKHQPSTFLDVDSLSS